MSSYEHDEDEGPGMDDPDESDMDEHDEPDLIPCPHCRKMIVEDAERCHHCGEWVEESRGGVRSWLTIIIAGLIILSMLMFAVVWLIGR